MNDFATTLLVLALPPAAIVFLALVWAKGWLRIGLTALTFLIPATVLIYALTIAGQSGGSFAAIGFATLGAILLAGAVAGALFGGLVVLFRHLRRRQAS